LLALGLFGRLKDVPHVAAMDVAAMDVAAMDVAAMD
jgi:hypothetical protein